MSRGKWPPGVIASLSPIGAPSLSHRATARSGSSVIVASASNKDHLHGEAGCLMSASAGRTPGNQSENLRRSSEMEASDGGGRVGEEPPARCRS